MEVGSIWFVATVQIIDGHESNRYFIACEYEIVKVYARSVYPLTVSVSRHLTQEDALGFVQKYFEGYEKIDLITM